MKEEYEGMLAALKSAVDNIGNIFTAGELNHNFDLISIPKRSVNLLDQTMALRDCVLRLKELLWLVGAPGCRIGSPKKEIFIHAEEILRENKYAYINRLEYWGYGVIKTQFNAYVTDIKITDLLVNITSLSNLLARDYLSESI